MYLIPPLKIITNMFNPRNFDWCVTMTYHNVKNIEKCHYMLNGQIKSFFRLLYKTLHYRKNKSVAKQLNITKFTPLYCLFSWFIVHWATLIQTKFFGNTWSQFRFFRPYRGPEKLKTTCENTAPIANIDV